MRAWLNLRLTVPERARVFTEGLERLGYEVVLGTTRRPEKGDIFVTWNRIHEGDTAARAFEYAGLPVIVAENASWGNSFCGQHWYTLARNYHNMSGRFPVGGPERWDKIREIGYSLFHGINRGDGNESMLGMQWGEGSGRAEVLQGLSRQTHESLARSSRADEGSAIEDECALLRERISEAGEADSATLPDLRQSGFAEASRGLQQAAGSEMAVPSVSLDLASGWPLQPWRKGGSETVVLPQRGFGSQVNAMPKHWPQAQHGRIRAHPGVNACVPLEEDLANAGKVVTWGSGAAIKALIMGIPVESHMPGWIGQQDNTDAGRLAIFRTLAWAQWTLAEIASGEPFKRLLSWQGESNENSGNR